MILFLEELERLLFVGGKLSLIILIFMLKGMIFTLTDHFVIGQLSRVLILKKKYFVTSEKSNVLSEIFCP